MMPATNVPWPISSRTKPVVTFGQPGVLSVTKAHPFRSSTQPLPSSSSTLFGISFGLNQTLACKSWCNTSIPVSSTATMTSRLPCSMSQARVALTAPR
jgi:hypothetical protein